MDSNTLYRHGDPVVLPGIVQVSRSRTFLPLLISTTFYWFSLNLLLMLVPRWVEEVLHLNRDADTWVMLPFALLADVIDLDSERSGIRREAIYFGVQAIFQKSMIGISVIFFAWSHEVTGPRGLYGIAVAAGVMCAAGFIAFCFYPVRR